jgi:hypothetical protein
MKFATLIMILLLAFAMDAAASTGMLAQSVQPDDGPDPGPLFVVLLFGTVFLILIGIGIVIGLAGLACAATFVALGVISSSAVVALFQRRFSAGFRALHYQILALIGLPCGIGSLWLGCLLFDANINHRRILIIGSVIGIVAGVIIAFVLDRFFQFVIRRCFRAPASQVPT